MKKILVPIDFSAVSRYVIDEAARLARLVNGRVILLHVVQPPTIVTDYGPLLGEVVQYTAAAEKGADRHLTRLCAKLKAKNIAAQTVRATNFPVLRILEQAKKLAVDYIVIGSHGHNAFYELLIGSTVSGVLKRATCPVVVVPSPQKPKARQGK